MTADRSRRIQSHAAMNQSSSHTAPSGRQAYVPPAPRPKSGFGSALSALFGERDTLAMLPREAYDTFITRAPTAGRPVFLVSHPDLVRRVLVDEVETFPKSPLMVNALKPLVGDGVFISGGETWARQREMIDPALTHMRVNEAFEQMSAATIAFEARAGEAGGAALSLDEEMSRLTADIMFRTIFSEPIEGEDARAVFRAFADFQQATPQIDLNVIFGGGGEAAAPTAKAAETCETIRALLGALIDRRIDSGATRADIAGKIIAARGPADGAPFTREELIDQIAVLFLAGHETSASALTWAFFILSQQPDTMARIREEVASVAGSGPMDFDAVRALGFTRNMFREVLRLYPPVSFIPRTARRAARIGLEDIPEGALVVVSPWLIHRNRRFWRRPNVFDPDRFGHGLRTRKEQQAYLPFGLGPRVCSGASFATTESTLILASVARRFDLETVNPREITPVGRLTTRPKTPVRMRFRPL